MIKSKKDYRLYLKEDLKAHKIARWNWYLRYRFPIVHYQRTLRKVEYNMNCKKGILNKIYLKCLEGSLINQGVKLGFSIGRNVFGPGLCLAHWGSIVVHKSTEVGENCKIHSAVNIGIKKGKCPVIGNNVYIGPGAKLFGGITIGDNVKIGANAVVNKDVPSNVTVVGIPARVVPVKQ
ncbi:DapH/DapD/GlmU-related protein [Peribacillus sp. SI8-4]|uniref:serine O-acetyltransferase n=1 Tax=Peribacillus sp. SI8-4 TaxID=3048009 RepID=UPI0025552BD3|nr:DapH/DapD/GlmU-related protein [Peribacillus sp. SI8-4]